LYFNESVQDKISKPVNNVRFIITERQVSASAEEPLFSENTRPHYGHNFKQLSNIYITLHWKRSALDIKGIVTAFIYKPPLNIKQNLNMA